MAMKKRVLIFLGLACLILSTVPAINLVSGNVIHHDKKHWWLRSVLYNVDFFLVHSNRLLYAAGISPVPHQVVIGKDGWLYIGDGYGDAISVARRGATPADIAASEEVGAAVRAWEEWFARKQVSLYKLILFPNKETIYPEFLPDWVQPASASAADTLLAHLPRGSYVDTRPALRSARSVFSEPLYYRTDTHWNKLGAWLAFAAFSRELARSEPGLRLLSDRDIRVLSVAERAGGDLANLLRIRKILRDSEVGIEITGEKQVEIEQYSFATGQRVAYDSNPQNRAQKTPLLLKTKNALNQKRVLWLHDSFGVAMAPFMAATFSDILWLHYDDASPAQLAQLVETYAPEYVFISVVERRALDKWFRKGPP